MRLILLIVLCLSVESRLPVYGQDKTTKAASKKKTSEGSKADAPQGQTLVTTADPHEPKADDKKDGKSKEPDSYLNALIAPNNLPNVILALVGIAGIVIAVKTLFWLKRQTCAIRRQAVIMRKQARHAESTSAQQATDVQASINEAVRSATAMEGVAASMAANVQSARETVEISREIAATQKVAIELQSRPYLSVFFNAAKFQDAYSIFEVQAVLKNHGSTPAYDVAFKAIAQIVPMPLPEDFGFPLPDDTAGTSVSLLAPGTTKLITKTVNQRVPDDQAEAIKRGGPPSVVAMWGIVNYRDAFKKPRYTKFAFTIYWIGWVPGMERDEHGNLRPETAMSLDTPSHNEAD